MQKLDRIQIKGFKSIQDLDLELNALNVLIGANGAGKSNFIEVFRLLQEIVKQRLQHYIQRSGGAGTLLHFGEKVTQQLRFKVTAGMWSYDITLQSSQRDKLFIEVVHSIYQNPDDPKYDHVITYSNIGWETELEQYVENVPEAVAKTIRQVWTMMNGFQVYHFHDTSDSALVKKTHDLNDNEYLRPDASNLAAFLYLLQQKYPHEYKQIVETIRLAAPFFDNFRLRPNPLNELKIRLEWREKNSDAYFDGSYLSDGTLRFMCLTTLLLQPNLPSTILIDEPELGLHPFAIALLASMLRSAATRSQVIVSTQSVSLINQFAPEDIIVVDRIDGASQFKRLDGENLALWLEDYGMGDLWEKNVVGGSPQR